MCIIAIKPAGVEMPEEETRRAMWTNNPDGAGYMYPEKGRVVIRKGFMSLRSMESSLKDLGNRLNLKELPMVLHYRIGTHGGNTPENTHPFPVTEAIPLLQKSKVKADLGVAHNGIIDGVYPRKGLSDTMEYIITQMAIIKKLRPDFYRIPEGKELLFNSVDSKLAFLDAKGRIETVGDFNKSEGVLFSNYSFFPVVNYTKKDSRLAYNSYLPSKYLMWLADEDGYVILDNGDIDSAEGFLVDNRDNLYKYSLEADMACRVDGKVFGRSGGTVLFDPERSSWTYTGTAYEVARASSISNYYDEYVTRYGTMYDYEDDFDANLKNKGKGDK